MELVIIGINKLNCPVNMLLGAAEDDHVDHKEEGVEDQVETKYEDR